MDKSIHYALICTPDWSQQGLQDEVSCEIIAFPSQVEERASYTLCLHWKGSIARYTWSQLLRRAVQNVIFWSWTLLVLICGLLPSWRCQRTLLLLLWMSFPRCSILAVARWLHSFLACLPCSDAWCGSASAWCFFRTLLTLACSLCFWGLLSLRNTATISWHRRLPLCMITCRICREKRTRCWMAVWD